jgi:hypothetical protein
VYVRTGNLLAQLFDPRSLEIQGAPLPIASHVYSFFQTGAADFSVSNNGMLVYRRFVSQSQLAWVDRRGAAMFGWSTSHTNGGSFIWLIAPFHESDPAFSPDDRWLAFVSNESGRAEVYVQAFEAGESLRLAGERHPVSQGGAVSLRWRRDGKELFYLGFDGRVYGVPVKLAPRFEAGPPVPLFTVSLEARAAIHSLQGFDVSPDGQQFLIPVTNSQEKADMIVIQNWQAEARRDRDNVK